MMYYDRPAQYKVATNLQFKKKKTKAVSVKHNKIKQIDYKFLES